MRGEIKKGLLALRPAKARAIAYLLRCRDFRLDLLRREAPRVVNLRQGHVGGARAGGGGARGADEDPKAARRRQEREEEEEELHGCKGQSVAQHEVSDLQPRQNLATSGAWAPQKSASKSAA